MNRAPSIDRKWLEAILAWVREGNVEPLIRLMRLGHPKTEDELKLLTPWLRQAKFKKRRGRKPDGGLIFAARLHEAVRKEGLVGDEAVDATIEQLIRWEVLLCDDAEDADRLSLVPDPDKLRNYIRRSKRPRRRRRAKTQF
jgi:hypothetical protein